MGRPTIFQRAWTRTPSLIQGVLIHVGDDLNIGDNDPGDNRTYRNSNVRRAIIVIDNSTAAKAMEDGWNVRVALEGGRFLGKVTKETIIYLLVYIPVYFDYLKFSRFRLSQHLSGVHESTIKLGVEPWWVDDDSENSGVRLWINDIFVSSGEKVEESIDSLMEKLQVHEDIVDPSFMEEFKSQREFDQQRNKHRTVWAIGDVVEIDNETHIVSEVNDLSDQWGIRLDRKYHDSIFMRVPK